MFTRRFVFLLLCFIACLESLDLQPKGLYYGTNTVPGLDCYGYIFMHTNCTLSDPCFATYYCKTVDSVYGCIYQPIIFKSSKKDSSTYAPNQPGFVLGSTELRCNDIETKFSVSPSGQITMGVASIPVVWFKSVAYACQYGTLTRNDFINLFPSSPGGTPPTTQQTCAKAIAVTSNTTIGTDLQMSGKNYIIKDNATLIFNGNTSISQGTVDVSMGKLIIQGDLTMQPSSSLVLNLNSSSVQVNGCANLNGDLVVNVSPEQYEHIKQSPTQKPYLLIDSKCISGDYDNRVINYTIEEDCYPLNHPRKSESGLEITFSVNEQTCDASILPWYYILIICVVVLLFSLILILSLLFFKKKIFPFRLTSEEEENL